MRNKYQEALDNLVHCKSITRCKECKHKNLCTMERDSKILQELVLKETPKKPTKEVNEHNAYDYICPNCKCCRNQLCQTSNYVWRFKGDTFETRRIRKEYDRTKNLGNYARKQKI